MTRRSSRTGKTSTPSPDALGYTNRKGATYYLHQGTTKTGKPRYFVAKTVREGALAKMPEGYEFSESINGVVSVRRVDPARPCVPETDLARVRAELARHPHLGRHRVDDVKGHIMVFEPVGGMPSGVVDDLSKLFGVSAEAVRARSGSIERRVRYDPVMRFVPTGARGHYSVQRMTYRGHGGWSWSLDEGPLQKLVGKYLKHVGTDEFFELM